MRRFKPLCALLLTLLLLSCTACGQTQTVRAPVIRTNTCPILCRRENRHL